MFILFLNATNFIRLFIREFKYKNSQFKKRVAMLKKNLICSPNSKLNYPRVSSIQNGLSCSLGTYSIIDISDDINFPSLCGKLILGNNVYIGEQCNIRASGSEIKIGSQTMIANNVIIVSANHKTALGMPMCLQAYDENKSGVKIGEDCWIGAHSTILPGATIGDGVVIAAGAVVRGTIPSFTIWGGVPAKFIKKRS
jgi:acetyltransferase-like isoleucine patch superfamily enzyme